MGIIQLYNADSRGVVSTRVCPLPDATEALVRREINGEYSLSVTLPDGAQFAAEATLGRAIKAVVNEASKEQYFIIKKRKPTLTNGWSIYAEHQSYYYNGVCLGPGVPNVNGYCANVFRAMRTYAAPSITGLSSFTYSRSADLRANFPGRDKPMPLMDLLKGWLIEAAGGELDFDGFSVTWADELGADNGAAYRYGANLTEMEAEDILDSYASGIYPFWGSRNSESQPYVEISGKILNFSGTFPVEVIVPVDLTDQFDEQPTQEALLSAAQVYAEQHTPTGIPQSIRANRARIAGDVPVDLGDTVTVVNPKWGVKAKTRIVALEFDALRERVKTVEFGQVNPGFPGAVKKMK